MFDSIGALNNLLLRRGRPLLPLILLAGANSTPESKASQNDNEDNNGNENNQHGCSKNDSNPHCDDTTRDTTTVFMTSVGPTTSTSTTTLTITPTSESGREETRTDSLATPDAAGGISPTQVQLNNSATGSTTVILPVTRVITATTNITLISTSTTAANTNEPANEEGTTNHSNAGIIAGSITGGIVLLASIGIAILIKRRRRQPVRMNHRTSSLDSVGLSSIFGSVPSFIQPISPTHDLSRTDKREIPPFTPGIFEDSDGVSLEDGDMHSLKVNHSSIP